MHSEVRQCVPCIPKPDKNDNYYHCHGKNHTFRLFGRSKFLQTSNFVCVYYVPLSNPFLRVCARACGGSGDRSRPSINLNLKTTILLSFQFISVVILTRFTSRSADGNACISRYINLFP